MTFQQAIDFLKLRYLGIWENESVDHEELVTMLSDFYDMGYEANKIRTYIEGYSDGYQDGQGDPLDNVNS